MGESIDNDRAERTPITPTAAWRRTLVGLAIALGLGYCLQSPALGQSAGSEGTAKTPQEVEKATPAAAADARQRDERPGKAWFDGKSLDGWKVADEFDFTDHGTVSVADGVIRLGAGSPGTGIVRTDSPPKIDYEIQLEARRREGRDFFCGLTFPIHDSFATLIVGGWGGSVVGLSNIDGASAAENSTSTYREFEQDRWYKIRLRVGADRIGMWIDDKQMIDQEVADHRFSLRWEVEPLRPVGIGTWYTGAELRHIRLIHPLPAADKPTKEKPADVKPADDKPAADKPAADGGAGGG